MSTQRNDHKMIGSLLTNSLFAGAPKKKISATTFQDFVEAAFLMGYTNAALSSLHYLRQAIKEGSDMSIAQGDLEINITDSWNDLATHRVGHLMCVPITLEDILKHDSVIDIVKKGSRQ